jgi:hypothetical protein
MGRTWGLMFRLLQLVLHRAYLNQRFPHMAESILPLIEIAERRVRLERMAMDYFAHFDSPMWQRLYQFEEYVKKQGRSSKTTATVHLRNPK